jgi:predicted ATPase/class 3 adenylate cyclase
MICPKCNFDNPEQMLYCGMCGTFLGQRCPACQAANPPGFIYCGMCGKLLSAEKVAAPILANGDVSVEFSPEDVSRLTAERPGTPLKELEGERRIATVILADVFSSTDLLEVIGTEAWVDIMNRVFQILETEIYRFGGHVDQFRGDGLVAFFGVSSAHEDDPERAVLAGLAMQREMAAYATELAQSTEVDLKIRVGINTGDIIVTSIGERSQHREDTAMGEAIAVAARMETAAEPGTVLVSENTYRLVERQFRWLPLGKIMVKGVSTPITVYRPLEYIQTAEIELGQEFRITTPLTGRDTEFNVMMRCIEELYGGSGTILAITGETGLGKSFLVTKVREHFRREEMLRAEARSAQTQGQAGDNQSSKITWLTGACRSYDQSWPYSMWLDMLMRWLGMNPDEPREQVAQRLYHESEALWGDNLAEHYPYLATFLSLPMEENYRERVRHLGAEGLQRQFRQAIRSWVEKLAQRGPAVFVFHDIHWADPSALELLRYCLPLSDSESILWIITMRPDRTSAAWDFRYHLETEYPHRMVKLDLQPLSEPEICELIDKFIGCPELSDDTRQLIIQKSDGNPYYVQELVRALIEQGVLQNEPDTGRYRETRAIASLDLPDSLQSLVLARIDRTSPDERRVLQMAAVIGQVFWWNVLQALAGSPNKLKANLTALQRSELIAERSQFPILGMEYEFTSTLIREVAYENLLSSQRSAFHTRTANFLESCTGLEGWGQYYSLVAYHYRCAGNHNKELYYTLQAAEQARRIYANLEAFQHYTNALNLLDDLKQSELNTDQRYVVLNQLFEVLKGRGEVSFLLGNIPDAEADLRALLPLAKKMQDDPAWMIDALLIQPEVVHPDTHSALQTANTMVFQALELTRQINDKNRELKSLMRLSELQFLQRDSNRYQTIEQALGLARHLGDRAAEVELLLALGDASGMDNLEKQQSYLEAALSICYELDDRKTEMRILHALGEQYERSGDYYRQLRDYEEKRLLISREIGDRLEEAHALMYCSQIRGTYLGDFNQAVELAEKSAQIWERITDRLYPNLRLAQMQVELGHFKDVQRILESIRPSAEQVISDVGRAGYYMVWAIYYNALGSDNHLHSVLDMTQRIIQLADDNLISRQYHMAAACEASAAHLALAALLSDKDAIHHHNQQALQFSQQSIDLLNRFGFVRVAECASEEIFFRHSLALEANGHEVGAQEYLKRAYTEMMRKLAFISTESHFRKTYLDNIGLHRTIRSLYESSLL